METMHSQLLLITFFAKVVVASMFFLVTFHKERVLVYCRHTRLKRTCSHRKVMSVVTHIGLLVKLYQLQVQCPRTYVKLPLISSALFSLCNNLISG